MKVLTHRITLPRGRRSSEVTSFFAQLDELSRCMLEDMRGASPAELAWQPKRGHNTIGMLLLHIAIVEVYWTLVAEERYSHETFGRAFGMGINDDGMPLPARGVAPAALKRKPLAFYAGALRRARAFSRRRTAGFTRPDLDRVITRTRSNGQRVRQNIRWILYHVLEHQAGHYGQALLLRHQYADRRRAR